MGIFKPQRISEDNLFTLCGHCLGAIMICYEHFHENHKLHDFNDRTKLKVLSKIIGIVLLYADIQLFKAKGPKLRSEAMDKITHLIFDTIADEVIPRHPEYKLNAFLNPWINIENINIETHTYLIGRMEEVFQKYGKNVNQDDWAKKTFREFAKELYNDIGINQADGDVLVKRFKFEMCLAISIGSIKFRELLT